MLPLAQSSWTDDERQFLMDVANSSVSYFAAVSVWVYVIMVALLVLVILGGALIAVNIMQSKGG